MLVLSRKRNESIIINGNIRVMIVGIKDNLVRIGIEAPEDVIVNREEIQEIVDSERNGGES